jgi:hypothetical protein
MSEGLAQVVPDAFVAVAPVIVKLPAVLSEPVEPPLAELKKSPPLYKYNGFQATPGAMAAISAASADVL